jgi:hypothetical protein
MGDVMNWIVLSLVGRLAAARYDNLLLHFRMRIVEARAAAKYSANLVRLERQNAMLLGSLRAIAAGAEEPREVAVGEARGVESDAVA